MGPATTAVAGRAVAPPATCERHLRLRVEIDRATRDEVVREITSTDFFEDLSGKASQWCAGLRGKEQS